MATTKRGRGRPKVTPDTATIPLTIPRDLVHQAESLVPMFDAASTLGVRHSRADVLRAAVTKGLEVLKVEVTKHR